MERKAKLVCSVVGFLGLLSAVLSFAAEGTKTTTSQIRPTPDGCVSPSSPAVGLGFAAAVVLLIAQTIITVTTVRICCRQGCSYRSKSCLILAVICFVVSWITFVIASLMIITGALLNQRDEVDSLNFDECSVLLPVLQPGVFAGAAVLSLTSLALGIVYYLVMDSTKIRNGSWAGTVATASNQSGIAMAQPQFPPPDTQAPVFVHEDTYMRRQFT
ncbi:hypothetical protein Vadar_001723 [Vaccinium darrowii]|uniref:Uncharacterized protein n=1 Tax=Vaccinium darrowii TaxID=229202 RepID=A0ACB7YJL0_9ERIC|nr:hypothetical protein Vadar_001723 [Vaccinium darrowii]